ncbi:MAG: hypothetical protein HKN09_12985 [Saprospiraceae bacterium]|nr:hypothetical protein [Saprospiraceae bacterium]
MKYSFYTLVCILFCTLISTSAIGQSNNDEAAVKAAIMDYVEGLYDADSTRIENSVHPTLRKIGYWYHKPSASYRDNLPMTYEQLVSLAARWNVDGTSANEDSPKDIVIFEVKDKTASAKLTAAWGVDYFHLGKIDGKWYIMNVIWQSLPEGN